MMMVSSREGGYQRKAKDMKKNSSQFRGEKKTKKKKAALARSIDIFHLAAREDTRKRSRRYCSLDVEDFGLGLDGSEEEMTWTERGRWKVCRLDELRGLDGG